MRYQLKIPISLHIKLSKIAYMNSNTSNKVKSIEKHKWFRRIKFNFKILIKIYRSKYHRTYWIHGYNIIQEIKYKWNLNYRKRFQFPNSNYTANDKYMEET